MSSKNLRIQYLLLRFTWTSTWRFWTFSTSMTKSFQSPCQCRFCVIFSSLKKKLNVNIRYITSITQKIIFVEKHDLLSFLILKNDPRKSENYGNYFAGISPFNGKKAGSRQIALWSRSVDNFFSE